MSDGIARSRLAEERKAWRKNHPHGFVAKPMSAPDGSVNLLVWQCVIPGKIGTDWEGGYFPLTINFSEDYPSKPLYASFQMVSSTLMFILQEMCAYLSSASAVGWRPSITVTQILVGIQDLLDQPNASDYAQTEGYRLYVSNPDLYRERVQQQVLQYPPSL